MSILALVQTIRTWSILLILVCPNIATNIRCIESIWIMTWASFVGSCVILVWNHVLIRLLHNRVRGSLLAWHTFWIGSFGVRINKLWVLISVVIFLFNALPDLFAYEWIAWLFILLRIVFEKCCWSWRLRLIMVACISTDIFTLIKLIIWM